jgi:hypothetical protein
MASVCPRGSITATATAIEPGDAHWRQRLDDWLGHADARLLFGARARLVKRLATALTRIRQDRDGP